MFNQNTKESNPCLEGEIITKQLDLELVFDNIFRNI